MSYGKYPTDDDDNTVIMEYDNFLPFLLPYLPVTTNKQFNDYITNNPDLLY